MIECGGIGGCSNWFHPTCLKMNQREIVQAQNDHDWICSICKHKK